MITGFVGTPGSGKSYEAVQKVLENLKLGRKVVTNIEGLDKKENLENIKLYCNLTDYQVAKLLHCLDNEEAEHFWDFCHQGELVLVDEVHKLFSNRDWASDKNREFTEWASTHRHLGVDVVLITQDIEKIDKHARSLIEWTHFFRKVNFLGGAVSKKYICYSYQGDNHVGKPATTSTRTYDPRIFDCYDSYVAEGVEEKSFMKHVNILKHPVFFAIPVIVLVFGFFMSRSTFITGDVFGTSTAVASEEEPVEKAELPVVKVDESKLMNTEGVEVLGPYPEGLPVEVKSPRDVVKAYKMPSGRIVWTNNGNVPFGGRYIKTLL